ncbi:interferon-induced protein with tetratricopeptide repeats 1-like isoform X5 [Amphiprion ocellaris]|uniref:interferon-induced protein with tetratricopeptide repeats 1-like isoform X4 n=1 Tax=Amphiprion ocellaris TaxID=80972 RepID=UPI002411253C|nr:interferon-induced protein with tetratricopeptide repeats 1-like isoform X4 [Amphiprion ocellaris]XP_054860854.1 interferon-induced protein with tetratricopeptide repeats 1-like isoform X5 [Amphiprion ocellaris]
MREAKQRYREKLESQLQQRNTRGLWQGLRTVTDYKATLMPIVSADISLADQLNIFYASRLPAERCASCPAERKRCTVTEHDVRLMFKCMNTKKAARPDGITGRVLKACANQLATSSLSQCIIPRYLQGRPQEALALLSQSEDRTRECYGDDSERRLIVTYGDMAWIHYHHGDQKQAESYCSRVQHILAVLGTPPEESLATKQLRRALKFSPDDGVLLALLALKLVQQHKYHEAEALVERALVGPDDDQVIRYVAKYLRMQDQLDQSIDLLHRALKGRSQSAFIHHQLGLCYLRKKKNLLSNKPKPEKEVQQWRRLSIHHLEEAIRLKNGLKSAKADLALQYAEESDMKRTSFNLLEELLFLLCFRAQEMFDDVLQELEEESPSIRQSMSRCYAEFCHYHSIQKDVAISFYKKALEFSTNTSDGKHCAKKLKLMAERRLRNNPADGASYGILGYVARAEGDYKRAAGFYEDALEREPENTEFLSVLCELRLQLY